MGKEGFSRTFNNIIGSKFPLLLDVISVLLHFLFFPFLLLFSCISVRREDLEVTLGVLGKEGPGITRTIRELVRRLRRPLRRDERGNRIIF